MEAIREASEREKIELNASMRHKLESVAAIEDGKKEDGKKNQTLSDEAIKAANQHHATIDRERTSVEKALKHLKILQQAHQDAEKRRVLLEEKISNETLKDLETYMKAAVEQITSEDEYKDTLNKLKEQDDAKFNTVQTEELSAISVLKKAVANFEKKLSGEAGKRQRLREFMK